MRKSDTTALKRQLDTFGLKIMREVAEMSTLPEVESGTMITLVAASSRVESWRSG